MTDRFTIEIVPNPVYEIEFAGRGPQGMQGPKGDTGVSVVGVEEISKVDLVATYRMEFSNGEYFDYQVKDGSVDGITRAKIIDIIGYEPASYTSVEGLTVRVETLEQRVEDLTVSKFPNAIIIGTPQIEGGQVSGFSDTDYMQFPFVDISRGLPFDIYFSFTTTNDITTQQNLLDSHFGIAVAIQNGKGTIALSSNGSSWDIGTATGTNTLLPNTTYYVKFSWTGTEYNASLSLNENEYAPDMVLASNKSPYKTTIFIGGSPNLFGPDSAHPFKGTINFNKSRVVVNGIIVWEGMADIGLASRANVSLNNLDNLGEARFNAKQDVLVSGTNIKTINNQSILGSGDIEIKSGGGLEVCDIGMALYVDETKGLRRYLNGQIIDINTNTQAFLNRLLQIQTTNPDYFTTEDNWQAEALLNIYGCVYKFVLNYADDGETVISVRLPKYPDYVEVDAGNVAVKGNGMTLGLSDGSAYSGTGTGGSGTLVQMNNYGANIGTSQTAGVPLAVAKTIGITTDPTKSGIVATLNQTKLKMRYFIQIATGAETENNIINDIELNNPYSLFDSKYNDHELNNLSWLKSEGQWNAKTVYPTAYDKLLKVYNGTETIEGLSVKLSTESYTDYDFVLNTSNETFRLPLKNHTADDGNSALTLYYYVGETVQNANLIDAGRIGEQVASLIHDNSSLISGYAMPSNKYIELTLGASGTTYTAPANGYYFINSQGTGTNNWIEFRNGDIGQGVYGTLGWGFKLAIPIAKGHSTQLSYNQINTTNYTFRFIYAEGEV